MASAACRNLRNRWLGSHATQEESNREGTSFTRRKTSMHRRGWRVSFIISLRRQAGIFIDYKFPSPWSLHSIPHRGRERERVGAGGETERERESREGVVIYEGPARGSFHTFLQSLSSLSSWKELIFMPVLERTFVTHRYSCIIRVYICTCLRASIHILPTEEIIVATRSPDFLFHFFFPLHCHVTRVE